MFSTSSPLLLLGHRKYLEDSGTDLVMLDRSEEADLILGRRGTIGPRNAFLRRAVWRLRGEELGIYDLGGEPR